jgi:gluconokinase
VIVVVMGVTGAGKTTIGVLLARRLGWEFADADNYHSTANVEKIRLGIPLDDADRAPWLRSLREAMERWFAERRNFVLACSALKQSYRDELYIAGQTRFVYLKGSYDLIYQRLRQRFHECEQISPVQLRDRPRAIVDREYRPFVLRHPAKHHLAAVQPLGSEGIGRV